MDGRGAVVVHRLRKRQSDVAGSAISKGLSFSFTIPHHAFAFSLLDSSRCDSRETLIVSVHVSSSTSRQQASESTERESIILTSRKQKKEQGKEWRKEGGTLRDMSLQRRMEE